MPAFRNESSTMTVGRRRILVDWNDFLEKKVEPFGTGKEKGRQVPIGKRQHRRLIPG